MTKSKMAGVSVERTSEQEENIQLTFDSSRIHDLIRQTPEYKKEVRTLAEKGFNLIRDDVRECIECEDGHVYLVFTAKRSEKQEDIVKGESDE